MRPKIFYATGDRGMNDAGEKVYQNIYGQRPPSKTKEFTEKNVTLGTREYRPFEAGTTKEDRDTISALHLLFRASTASGLDASKDLYDAARRLMPTYAANLEATEIFPTRTQQFSIARGKYATTGTVTREPLDPKGILGIYVGLLREYIAPARLTAIAQKDGTPAIAVLCPNIKVAAFVFAAYRGMEVCEGCNNLFVPKPGQKHCSNKCRERVASRRYHKRQIRAKRRSR